MTDRRSILKGIIGSAVAAVMPAPPVRTPPAITAVSVNTAERFFIFIQSGIDGKRELHTCYFDDDDKLHLDPVEPRASCA